MTTRLLMMMLGGLILCSAAIAYGQTESTTEVVSVVGETEDPADQVNDDPVSALAKLVDAIRTGNMRLVVSLVLAFVMFGLAKFRSHIPWFSGDRGGAILVMALALLGGVSTALASGAPLDAKLFIGIVAVAWTAVGGVQWVKRLLWPAEK